MLSPSISESQFVAAFVVVVFTVFVAVKLLQASRLNTYPTRETAAICLTFAAWISISLISDRTTNALWLLWLSRATYVLPVFVLFLLNIFALEFPPRAQKNIRIFIITISLVLSSIVTFLAFNRRGLVIYFDATSGDLLTNTGEPYYLIIMAIYSLFIISMLTLFAMKWRWLNKTERKILVVILSGFLLTTVVAIFFSVISAYNLTEIYTYYYSYLSSIFIIFGLGFAILKYGALKTPIIFSKHLIFVVSSTIVIAAIVFVNRQEIFFGDNITFKISILALIYLVPIVSVIIYRNYTGPSLFRKNNIARPRDTSEFLTYIKNKHGVSKCVWTSARPIATTANNIWVNTVALPRGEHIPMFKYFTDRSIDWTAVIISTKMGRLELSKKRYNLAFSANDIKKISHDANLYATHLEITTISRDKDRYDKELAEVSVAHQNAVHEADQRLKSQLRKRSEFFNNIASKLKSPLTVVYAALQQNTLGLAREETITNETQVKKLLAVCDDFKEVDEKSSRKDQIIDLNIYLKNICNNFLSQAHKKKIFIKTLVAPQNARVKMTQKDLDKIMDNLLSNALKFSPHGSKIIVSAKCPRNVLTISVKDQAAPIAKSERTLIFEPFYRSSSAKNKRGTGLGLSTISRIAKKYKGEAYVDSTVHGNTFTVLLHPSTLTEENQHD